VGWAMPPRAGWLVILVPCFAQVASCLLQMSTRGMEHGFGSRKGRKGDDARHGCGSRLVALLFPSPYVSLLCLGKIVLLVRLAGGSAFLIKNHKNCPVLSICRSSRLQPPYCLVPSVVICASDHEGDSCSLPRVPGLFSFLYLWLACVVLVSPAFRGDCEWEDQTPVPVPQQMTATLLASKKTRT